MKAIAILCLAAALRSAAAASCVYQETSIGYSCEPFIANSSIEGTPLVISGEHLNSKTDVDVINLRADNSSLESFPNEILRKFVNLKYLSLINVNMKIVGQLNNCATLQKLNLYLNNITELSSRTFANCPNLKELDLGRNEISELNGEWFEGIENLEILLLDSNLIAAIPANAFSSMPNLKTLQLSSNQIEHISANAFNSLGQLEHLYLDHNELRPTTASTVNNIPSLITLSLSSNYISDGLNIRDLEKLENLYLSSTYLLLIADFLEMRSLRVFHAVNNQLFNIDYTANISENLEILALSSNLISNVNKDPISRMTNLYRLELNDNVIGHIDSEVFVGFTRLDSLILSNNHFTDLSFLKTDGLSKARFLDISYNSWLKDLGIDTFKNMNALMTAHLSNNIFVTELRSESFGNITRLRFLHIDGNQIEKIEKGFFDNFPNIEMVFAEGNKCVNTTIYIVTTEIDKFKDCFNGASSFAAKSALLVTSFFVLMSCMK